MSIIKDLFESRMVSPLAINISLCVSGIEPGVLTSVQDVVGDAGLKDQIQCLMDVGAGKHC